MKIDVYTMVHNEETLLPYFLRHYGRFANRITVFDNESDDRTADIATRWGAEVIPIDTGGKHRTSVLQRVMNEEYKRSRGKADWVICAEGDEFFWHPDLPGLLSRYAEEGVTLPRISGFDMVSDGPPKGPGHVFDEIKFGFPNVFYDKRGVFHPSLDINFEAGGHHVHPEGNVVESEDSEITLLHYRYLGEEYFTRRYQEHRKRISEENVREKWGLECLKDHQERFRGELALAKEKIVQVVP